MTEHEIDGPVRSSREVHFYITLHPCEVCGSRSDQGLRYDSSSPDENTGRAWNFFVGPCSDCQARRFFRFITTGDEMLSEPERGHLGGAEPSQIISPVEFQDELERLAPDAPDDPRGLEWPAYKHAWAALNRIEKCCNELLKFLPAGADEIPLEHFRTDEARAGREARPEAFTRAALEALHARWMATIGRYEADLPRYHALRREAEGAAPPPPPPPAFTRESLDAHRRWVESRRQLMPGEKPLTPTGPVQRLEAADVAQPGARLAAVELSGSVVRRADLSEADLSFCRALSVEWVDVKLRRARLSSTTFGGSRIEGCDFSGAGLGLTVLGDCEIDRCTFTGAHADRSSWYRSEVTRSIFDGVVFGQAAFDHAVFVDCSFVGANLAMDPKNVMGTMARAWFYRCDFSDVDWTGRCLFEPVFIDCTFGGIRGTPKQVQDVVLFRCTLEPEGRPVTIEELVRLWKVLPEHFIDSPDKAPRANRRSIGRRAIRDGKVVTVYTDEYPPLIQMESERDPSLPVPVPFGAAPVSR